MTVDKDILDDDASEGKKAAEQRALSDEVGAHRRMSLSERESKLKIGDEHLKAMQWLRWTRLFVAIFAAAIPIGMLALLGFALFCPIAKKTVIGKLLGSGFYVHMWPKLALISGTFLTFIFVFGALVKGVFASSREKVNEPPSHQNATEWAEKIARSSLGE